MFDSTHGGVAGGVGRWGGAGGGEGLSFSPVGLARSRGSEAAGHILVERRAEGGLGGPGGLMCFPPACRGGWLCSGPRHSTQQG